MTVAEIVSELLYAGKTRAEIAGYDDAFMRWVLCKPRDESGQLIRQNPELPWWVTTDARGQWVIKDPVPFSTAYNEVMEALGMDERQRRLAWASFKQENPGYGKGGG